MNDELTDETCMATDHDVQAHISSICSNLYQFYQEQYRCDVIFITTDDGKRIVAHSIVLSTASAYLKSLFLRNVNNELYEVQMNQISGETLKQIIEFSYTGQINLNEANARNILEKAHLMEFRGLVRRCVKWYTANMNASNCISTKRIAEDLSVIELQEAVLHFLYAKFVDVIQSDEFGRLALDESMTLLRTIEIDAMINRGDILKAIECWINFDHKARKNVYQKIFGAFQMTYVTVSECEQNNQPKSVQNQMENLIAIGYDDSLKIRVERHSHESNSWNLIGEMRTEWTNFNVEYINNKIILIGGLDDDYITNKVGCLYSNRIDTDNMAPMLYRRAHMGTVVHGNCILALGGMSVDYVFNDDDDDANKNNKFLLDTFERYDMIINKWSEMPPMTQKRSSMGLAILSDKVFAVGGQTVDDQYLSTVECYDFIENKWTFVASMNESKAHNNCFVSGNKLYTIGGRLIDGNAAIEQYNEQIDKWLLINVYVDIPNTYGLASQGDWVYTVGDKFKNGLKFESILKLNVSTDEMIPLPKMSNNNLRYHLVVVPAEFKN